MLAEARREFERGRDSADKAILLEGVLAEISSLDLSLKTFLNADGTVDGEVRITEIPNEMRTEEGLPFMKEMLSRALKAIGTLGADEEGGAYWISIGVRFGPSNESEIGELAELYKRHRGLFQVASFSLDASISSGMQNAVVAIGDIIGSLMERRGLPPSAIFVRFTWTPDGSRPDRYKGERGKNKK